MYSQIKKLGKTDTNVYSCSHFPLKKIGFLKFWVEVGATQDIRDGKIMGVVHPTLYKKVKIKIPAIGHKKGLLVTPEIVLSQLDREDFPQFEAYSVKIGKPVYIKNNRPLIAPDYFDATVTLFQADRPKKLILKNYDLPQNPENKNNKEK